MTVSLRRSAGSWPKAAICTSEMAISTAASALAGWSSNSRAASPTTPARLRSLSTSPRPNPTGPAASGICRCPMEESWNPLLEDGDQAKALPNLQANLPPSRVPHGVRERPPRSQTPSQRLCFPRRSSSACIFASERVRMTWALSPPCFSMSRYNLPTFTASAERASGRTMAP